MGNIGRVLLLLRLLLAVGEGGQVSVPDLLWELSGLCLRRRRWEEKREAKAAPALLGVVGGVGFSIVRRALGRRRSRLVLAVNKGSRPPDALRGCSCMLSGAGAEVGVVLVVQVGVVMAKQQGACYFCCGGVGSNAV